MVEEEYGAIPLRQLGIEAIHWTEEAATHITTRTARYPDRDELDVEPEWATEAALDPHRLVALTGGLSIEVIGWSPSAPPREGDVSGRVLKVWVIPDDARGGGSWLGASACAANRQERQRYVEVNHE
jgi:hypothetical protein